MSTLSSPWVPIHDGILSLSVHATPNTPPTALYGIADWIHRVAIQAHALDGLPFSVESGRSKLSVHWDSRFPHALIRRTAHRLDVFASDADSCNRLFWFIGHALDVATPPQWRSLADTGGSILSDGNEVPYPERLADAPAGNHPSLLDLVPGQGPIHPFLIPEDVSLEWMKALINYVARASVSSFQQPLARVCTFDGGSSGIVTVGDHPSEARVREGRVVLPLQSASARLLQHLASLPTYPERPFVVRTSHRAAAHPPEIIFTKTAQIPWEVHRLEHLFDHEVLRHVSSGCRIEIFASEDEAVLESLRSRMERRIALRDCSGTRIHVLPAYNQVSGFAKDVFVPEAEATLGDLEAVSIGIPECPASDDKLERLSAWAPTIVPFDEWLRRHRPAVKTTLAMISGDAFQLVATRGSQTYREFFTPITSNLDLDRIYPGKRSQPETAGIRLRWMGQMREWPIPTDTEAAFRTYLDLLPELTSRLIESRNTLPLFEELSVEMFVSDPDRFPNTATFSPLDELHEEIYFGTLAHFEPLTSRLGNGDFRAPGLIIPRVHRRAKSDTEVAVKVSAPQHDLTVLSDRPLTAESITEEGGLIRINTNDPLDQIEPTMFPEGIEVTDSRGNLRRHGTPPAVVMPQDAVHPDKVWELSWAVAHDIGALAWVDGQSFGGRPIPVILWAPQLIDTTASPKKMAQRLPSILVVAGHHANEPSSTPAAFRLASQLKQLHPSAVVGIIPLENPDGASLYHQLRAEHPNWKIHAARFNMVGHEFARDYDRPSPFGEAKVRPGLESHLSVNAVIDNHGVPAVPWIQPFSGRTSPPLFWFNYTYPSGLIYGIGDGDESGQPTAAVARYWTAITRRLARHRELVNIQRALWQQYVRYGVDLAPQDYPSRTVEGWPFQSMAQATSSYRYKNPAPIRFITEVADEGASPELFSACIAAHTEANLAVIEALADASEC